MKPNWLIDARLIRDRSGNQSYFPSQAKARDKLPATGLQMKFVRRHRRALCAFPGTHNADRHLMNQPEPRLAAVSSRLLWRAQDHGAVTLNQLEALEIAHTQQDLVAGHIGQDRGPHPLSRQSTQIDLVKQGGPGLDIPIGGSGDSTRSQAQIQFFCQLERQGHIRCSRIDHKEDGLAIDPPWGDVVPPTIARQHHLVASPAIQADLQVLIRILPLIHEALEHQDQQCQANDPGREQHGAPDPGGRILDAGSVVGHDNR